MKFLVLLFFNQFYLVYGFFIDILNIFIVIIPLLVSVAFFTLIERKILAAIQKRQGPNIVGIFGLLQPFADAIKLLIKETILPIASIKFIFFLAPILTFFLSLIIWAVLPLNYGIVIADIELGLLYLFAISSLGVYGIIIAGWSSNSRYAFFGALRSAAQMISYEVSLGLILINLLLIVGSLNLTKLIMFQEYIWFIFPFFPLFLMFFITALAETNRVPFDLPEAEAELVSGYNVEYSSVSFALFFIGEYLNIILMSYLTVIFFLGGWLSPLNFNSFLLLLLKFDFFRFIYIFYLENIQIFWFILKVLIIMFLFVWVRGVLPRYRYDQLMRLGWKVFLPISLSWVFLVSLIIYLFDIF